MNLEALPGSHLCLVRRWPLWEADWKYRYILILILFRMEECTGQYSLVTRDRNHPPTEPNGTFVSENRSAGSARLELDVHTCSTLAACAASSTCWLHSLRGVPLNASARDWAPLGCCTSFLWLLSRWPVCGCKTIGIYSLTVLEAKTSKLVPMG